MRHILLDTNAYARFLVDDQQVLYALASADVVFMSIFVLGELHAGFSGGSKYQENCTVLQRFLSKSPVKILNGSLETAEIFGSLKNTLKRAGTPLPINDVWIAAHAIESGSVVITYDEHFRKIPGLRLWPEMKAL